jgi:folate-binding protein YgfZ
MLLGYNQKLEMTLVRQQEQPTSWLSAPVREQFKALVAGCGAYQPKSALISLTGGDRVRWLNGMVSNNIRDLAAGHGAYAFVLNAQGHIQGDLYAFNRGESLILKMERTQVEKLLEIFRRYIIMDKVEIEDLSEQLAVIGVAGPQSAKLLNALGFTVENLGALQMVATPGDGTLVRGDNPCVPSYELWVRREQVESVWAGARNWGAEQISTESREAFRIACGIPKIGQDIRERDLPQETGQERALSSTKGCYIGQEIVERIRSRGAVHRALLGFEADGALSAGMRIHSEAKDVGEITSVAAMPTHDGERVIALGYLRKEHAERKLTAGETEIRPVSLPFLEKMKVDG